MVDLSVPDYLQRSKPSNDYTSGPRYFKRKRNQIEAVRVDEENVKTVAKWCGGEAFRIGTDKYIKPAPEPGLRVPSLGDPIQVWLGEWLIKDEDGRFSVMSNKEFMEEYEFD